MTAVPTLPEPVLLAAWEGAVRRPPGERAGVLAAAAAPVEQRAEVGRWSVGRRDALLLDLHVATFGDRVAGLIACPECGDTLELGFRADDVRAEAGDPGAEHELAIEETGHLIVFQVPGLADVAAAASSPDLPAARLALVERCVVRAEQDGRPVPAGNLPEGAVAALGEAIALRDPQADVRLGLSCPACDHGWSAPFDVADFLWREVDERARALMGEVAALAAAFGWSEDEILGLSEQRRGRYLELAGA